MIAPYNKNKKVIFKNCAPFTNYINETYREIGFNKLNSGIKNGTEVTF